MRTLAAYVPGLICAGGMLLCMRMMRRGSNDGGSCHETKQEDSANAMELAELHEEVTRLRAEVRLRDQHEEPRL